jgi:archaemetzincin
VITVDHAGDAPAEVVAVGAVHEVACAVVVAHLGIVIGLPARRGPALTDAALHTDGGRQIDAALLIRRLAENRPPDRLRVGVTELDLCLPVFTHLYGEARVGGGVAVASIYRLRGDAAPPRPDS